MTQIPYQTYTYYQRYPSYHQSGPIEYFLTVEFDLHATLVHAYTTMESNGT